MLTYSVKEWSDNNSATISAARFDSLRGVIVFTYTYNRGYYARSYSLSSEFTTNGLLVSSSSRISHLLIDTTRGCSIMIVTDGTISTISHKDKSLSMTF